MAAACVPQKACSLQDLQCACLRQVLSACPHLEQLTVEVVDLSIHPVGVQGWAEKLVNAIRDVQRSSDMARLLRRLQLVPTSASVSLKSLWYVREPAYNNAQPALSCYGCHPVVSRAACPYRSQCRFVHDAKRNVKSASYQSRQLYNVAAHESCPTMASQVNLPVCLSWKSRSQLTASL